MASTATPTAPRTQPGSLLVELVGTRWVGVALALATELPVALVVSDVAEPVALELPAAEVLLDEVAAAIAVKANVPLTGWPSAEVTRHTTLYGPAGSAAGRATETLAAETVGLPATSVPDELRISILVPVAITVSEKVRRTDFGAVTLESAEGVVLTNWSCADAGPAEIHQKSGSRSRSRLRYRRTPQSSDIEVVAAYSGPRGTKNRPWREPGAASMLVARDGVEPPT